MNWRAAIPYLLAAVASGVLGTGGGAWVESGNTEHWRETATLYDRMLDDRDRQIQELKGDERRCWCLFTAYREQREPECLGFDPAVYLP